MASFIVEGAGPNGVRTWVVIEATDSSDARNKSRQILEEGFTPNISVPADASGVATLNSQSPGFSARFPSNNYTTDSIVSELGGAVQRSSAPPPDGSASSGSSGGAGGAGGAGGQSFDQTPAGPILGSEDFGLLPAFEAGLRDRGMGYGIGSGVAGQLAGQEFGNLQSRGLLDAAFFAPPGQIDTSKFADADRPTAEELNKFQGTTFQDYVKNAALFGGGATADANRLFSEALRLSQGRTPGFTRVVDPDDTEKYLNRFDAPGVRGLPTPIAGAFLNPQQGSAGSEDLARAARQAGRSRFGFASKFLPSASNLTNSFFAQPQQGAQTFADFLSNKIFGVLDG